MPPSIAPASDHASVDSIPDEASVSQVATSSGWIPGEAPRIDEMSMVPHCESSRRFPSRGRAPDRDCLPRRTVGKNKSPSQSAAEHSHRRETRQLQKRISQIQAALTRTEGQRAETAQKLQEAEQAWQYENIRQVDATRESMHCGQTLGYSQQELSQAHREIEQLRQPVNIHSNEARIQAEWNATHAGEIEYMRKFG